MVEGLSGTGIVEKRPPTDQMRFSLRTAGFLDCMWSDALVLAVVLDRVKPASAKGIRKSLLPKAKHE